MVVVLLDSEEVAGAVVDSEEVVEDSAGVEVPVSHSYVGNSRWKLKGDSKKKQE